MNSKDVIDRFNEIINQNNFTCSQSEFNDFLLNGLIFKKGDKYVTRNNNIVNLNIIPEHKYRMNINLVELINQCELESKKNNIKRIYCMRTKKL